MSGALQGAGSGAVAGSAFGPWGTVAGAAIGALGSFFGQQSTNATNIKLAEEQMAFQKWSQLESERYNTESQGTQYGMNAALQDTAIRANQYFQQNAQDYNAQQANNQMVFQQRQAEEAMTFDANQQAQIEGWEENMSNTAYQRSVRDMKAAGLNPILGVASGGASTPSVGVLGGPVPSGAAGTSPGASAPGASVGMPSVGMQAGTRATVASSIGGAINSALAAADTFSGVGAKLASVDKIRADANYTNASADLVRAQLPGAAAHSAAQQLETQTVQGQLQLLAQQIANADKTEGLISAQTKAQLSDAMRSGSQAALAAVQAGYTGDQRAWAASHGGTLPPTASSLLGTAQSLGSGLPGGAEGFNPIKIGQDLGDQTRDWVSRAASAVGSWLNNGFNSAYSAATRYPAGSPPPVIPGYTQ